MEIQNTADVQAKCFILIMGQSGIGKTYSASTLDGKTIILNLEGGLLSLKSHKVDFVTIEKGNSPIERWNNLKKLLSECAKSDYDNLFIDSLSEASDILLAASEENFPEDKKTMLKWGFYLDNMKAMIKFLRDIPKNVFVTTLLKTSKDELGRRFFTPDIHGQMAEKINAYFDVILCMHMLKTEDKEIRVLQTQPDNGYACKDRSGSLDKYEKPNLQNILTKIKGV